MVALPFMLMTACSIGPAPAGDDAAADAGGSLDAAAPDATIDAGPSDATRAADGGVCEPMPIYPPDLLPECPTCAGARCVPGDSLTSDQRALFMDCSDTHECVPDEYLLAGENLAPHACIGAFGAQGRCLSACLAGVYEERDLLPVSTCPTTHRCVPCVDPFDGSDTGACAGSCDDGPTEPRVVLPSCCEDRGVCLPTEGVPAGARPYYDACDGASLCIPRPIVGHADYVAATCTSPRMATTYGDAYGPGVCAHVCQAGIAAVSSFYERADCGADFVCVTCLNPLTGEPTGACP